MWKSLGAPALLILSVAARIAAMLAAFKFLSIAFGAEGFGLLSQVMAVGALFATFAGGGLQTGLVRQVAAASEATEQGSWLKAAAAISIACACLLTIVALLLYAFAGGWILGDASISWVFLVIAAVQIPLALGSTALAYLSGAGMPSAYGISGIAGSIVAATLVILLGTLGGYAGALAACALFALGPALIAISQIAWRKRNDVRAAIAAKLENVRLKTLLGYSLSMFIAAAAVPLALIHMRSSLAHAQGWHTVGEWQSVARIGDAYIQVFGVIFINLMLPRLSAAAEPAQQRHIVRQYAVLTAVLFACGGAVFLAASKPILGLVYTESFAVASVYVLPQLVADFLKVIASWFVYLHMARGRPSIQAAGEVIQAFVMVLAFHGLLSQIGGLAAPWAYAAGVSAVLLYLLGVWVYQHGPAAGSSRA